MMHATGYKCVMFALLTQLRQEMIWLDAQRPQMHIHPGVLGLMLREM